MADFAALREKMVEQQIVARGISNPAVLEAMRAVPREAFVREHLVEFAYDDSPLPIEAEQTISQPYIVALMIEAAGIKPGDKVLEIGAGSGYAAAVIGRIAREVISIERRAELAVLARTRMASLGYRNVAIVEGDGTAGCRAEAPFDAILVAASGPETPFTLLNQLRKPGHPPQAGGRLVMPVGEQHGVQRLIRTTRASHDVFPEEDLGPVRFVPLIGVHGWSAGP